jgi:hypothetical protein
MNPRYALPAKAMELIGIALIVWMARRLGVLLMMRFREPLL